MSPAELTSRLDQVALAEVGSLNRIVRSDESATIERIDTLESSDTDCDPVISAERSEAKERFRAAFAQPQRSRSARSRCCCTSRDGRCATSASASASPRAAISQIHTQLRRRLYEQLSGELRAVQRRRLSAAPALKNRPARPKTWSGWISVST